MHKYFSISSAMPKNWPNLAAILFAIFMVLIVGIAVVQQEFSWWAIPLVILFGTICLAILSMAFSVYREDKTQKLSQKMYPGQPWMWDARWQSDIIPSQSRWEFWGCVFFTIILLIFAFIGVVTILRGLPEGNLFTLLNFIPIIAATYFLKKSVDAWSSTRFNKQVSLILMTRPAWIGSQFTAHLSMHNKSQIEDIATLLQYIKIHRVEGRDETIFQKRVDLEIPATVEICNDDDGRFYAKINVDLPDGIPETSWLKEDTAGWWNLDIKMVIENSKIQLSYQVPVADPKQRKIPK